MLEVRGISKHFGGQAVLRDVNLAVAPGEVVGLIGMNGSGKTTLLEILSGRARADAGEVWIDGRRAVPRCGFAPRLPVFRSYQVPRLFYGLSVAENLKLGRWSVSINDGPGRDTFPSPTRERPAEMLSTGQRRRVILDWLRVRVEHAKYFLLDEPAAGGDDALVGLLIEFLREARGHRCGVLLVEHRNGVLRRACDRVVQMRDGACWPHQAVDGDDSSHQCASEGPLTEGGDKSRLVARELVVSRGGAVVLSGVNFTAGVGEVVAVTGPNGCGKSTLLGALYGDPSCALTSGALTSDATDLTTLGLRERATLGVHLLPQEGALFPSMTTSDALRMSVEAVEPGAWSPEATERVRREFPALDRIWRRPCGLLSGGERRLASLARVFLLHPRVALLDEPLAGIDVDCRKRIIRAVEQLAENGAAVVVAEQASEVRWVPYDYLVNLASDRPDTHVLRSSDGS